jgi:hypothetical protein
MFFVLEFELILIIGSNNVLTEGARKYIAGAALDRAGLKVSMDFHFWEDFQNIHILLEIKFKKASV